MRKYITKAEAQEWASALRSGEYKQGIRKLQSSYGYCCLGVACIIFIPVGLRRVVVDINGNKILHGVAPGQQYHAPEWLKNVSDDLEHRTGVSFVSLNDRRHFRFDEIADIIELVYVHRILGRRDEKKALPDGMFDSMSNFQFQV